MDYITRTAEADIRSRLFKRKAVIVFGPRQSGKTTMIRHLVRDMEKETLWLNGDAPDVQAAMESVTVAKWRQIIGKKTVVVIDEAQRIANVGMAMKLVTDELPGVQLIASGSSAFDLAGKTSEPLTGRALEYRLLPLSFEEMAAHYGLLAEKGCREQRLLFGSYPEIVGHQADAQRLLGSLAGSYLYKDLLMLDGLKKPSLLGKLIRAVALQLGSEVKTSELAALTGADNKTVDRYLDLLEKSFVLFALPAFSRNARNEIKKGRKIYFHDIGIRNAVLGNFTPLASRADAGGMWENYLVLERLKSQCNLSFPPRRYFWRTLDQREVDYIEETADGLRAYEFKSNAGTKAKIPAAFTNAYPDAVCGIVTPDNYEGFVSGSCRKQEDR